MKYIFLALFALTLPITAHAQSTSGDFSGGSVIVGADTRTCDGTLTGALRYSGGAVEICDGSAWAAPGGGAGGGSAICGAPTNCTDIGEVCDDSDGGTSNDPILAGFVIQPDLSCDAILVSDDNQSLSSEWKTSTGTDDIATDSFDDGRDNVAQITVSTDFPAFKLCDDLSDGGFSDWYLPARTELDFLWENRADINANAAGNFTTNNYWTSTEDSTNFAWYLDFDDGQIRIASKTNNNDVRCIRRVDATPSAGGGGGGLCTAPALCPNVGDVCDDSDAGTTNDPIFAGYMFYDAGCEPLFVSDNNQSTSSKWKISTGVDDTAIDYYDDGKANVAQITVSTDFPAFKDCDDLTDGGYSDWYLPARTELDLLWQNRTVINANAAGNFTTSLYWSSTEYSEIGTSNSWSENFSGGATLSSTKTNNRDVRCVRRD